MEAGVQWKTALSLHKAKGRRAPLMFLRPEEGEGEGEGAGADLSLLLRLVLTPRQHMKSIPGPPFSLSITR